MVICCHGWLRHGWLGGVTGGYFWLRELRVVIRGYKWLQVVMVTYGWILVVIWVTSGCSQVVMGFHGWLSVGMGGYTSYTLI